MNDKKDNQTNDKQQTERNDHAVAHRGWHARLRRDIEQLVEAYGGDYSEVLDAYRHAAQSANRRATQLRREAILAKHDAKVAYCELRLATAIIDEMSRQAATATCDDGTSDAVH
jgi:uncharacterized NAD(P)/FAD-binding protein YdhS